MSNNKIERSFKEKIAKQQNIIAPYIMAGDGGLDQLEEQILFLQSCGVAAIELGIPFSDPVADGPTIQAAGERSLASGTTLARVLDTLRNFKQAPEIPIILMTYLNLIYTYGIDQFAHDCKQAGVDGVIIPDLPLEEESLVTPSLKKNSLSFIRLAALTSPKERLKQLAKRSEGFLYAVSVTGTTGTRATYEQEVTTYLHKLKETSPVPVLAGFGISTAQQAQDLSSACDGVIIGSTIVQLLHEGKRDQVKKLIADSL